MKSVMVWDPLVRCFHWALLAFIALAYTIEGSWPQLHSHAGNCAALLVAFRLLWGIVGSRHARFADFVPTTREVLADARRLFTGSRIRHIGHDPLGAVMIMVLLLMVLVTILSGMILFAMEGSGPLAGIPGVNRFPGGLLAVIHDLSADMVVTLAVVHVSGVLLTSYQHRINLTWSMFTGRKRVEQ